MKNIDMRFDQEVISKWIGQTFVKYKCDPFIYTNSVTSIIGLYIDKNIFELNNIQATVDYFGTTDDCGVFTVKESEDAAIKSFFDNVEQIDMPISEKITKITLVNENQRIYENGKQTYNVWLTRGIIFHFKEREISFEKDSVPFSEEIIIQKGYGLINKFSDEKDFLEGWADEKIPACSREILTIE